MFLHSLSELTIHKANQHELQRLKDYPIGDSFTHHLGLIISGGNYALINQDISKCFPASTIDVLNYTSLLGKLVDVEFNMYSNRRGGTIKYEARKIICLD